MVLDNWQFQQMIYEVRRIATALEKIAENTKRDTSVLQKVMEER